MNRVLIYGGLGNQMFQYALHIVLNEKNIKTRILIFTYFYNSFHNSFNLGKAFRLKLPFHQRLLMWVLLKSGRLYKNKIANIMLTKMLLWYKKKFYTPFLEEKEFQYDAKVFQQNAALLIGTWQAESYFRDFDKSIREAFEFKIPEDSQNKAIIDKITNSNSVSLHVRRGDYLASEWNKTHAVIQGTTYYVNAMNYINEKVKNPHYFIFSDDIEWVKNNLVLSNATYVDHNKAEKSHLDMYLMSCCKHNIIANSTFSWWAAWLNSNKDKMVIMPEKWINNTSCDGIYPFGWIKMKV